MVRRYCSHRYFYAIVFGLDASSIDLGSAEHARGNEISSEAKLTANTLPQQILELPSNPFLDFTGQRTTSTIAVVIFAIFVGFAYLRVARKQPDNGSLLKRGIDAVYASHYVNCYLCFKINSLWNYRNYGFYNCNK